MADYNPYPGGNDVISEQPMLVTDLIRGDQYQVQIVDFYIDEMSNGIVFFDGTEILRQTNITDYSVLERLFYSQFSVQM
jgi:hypothetical protein